MLLVVIGPVSDLYLSSHLLSPLPLPLSLSLFLSFHICLNLKFLKDSLPPAAAPPVPFTKKNLLRVKTPDENLTLKQRLSSADVSPSLEEFSGKDSEGT